MSAFQIHDQSDPYVTSQHVRCRHQIVDMRAQVAAALKERDEWKANYAALDAQFQVRNCPHRFEWDFGLDCLSCTGCGLQVSGESLQAFHVKPVREKNLADECGRLATENSALLIENATLRRRIEKLERKK